MDPELADQIYELDRCIECGCCVAACGTARMREDFVGAVGLNKIARFRLDPRDTRTDDDFYELVGDDDGVFGCMTLLGCHDVCPKQPAAATQIAFLRRKMVAMAWQVNSFGLDKQRYPGDGVVTGFGKVNGRRVAVFAPGLHGAGRVVFSEVQSQKISRIQDLALESGIPLDRPERLRRRAHSGRRAQPGRLRRSVRAQRAGLGRDPADLAHPGPLRGRRGVFAGADRLRGHGRRQLRCSSPGPT
jgi:ferredoxin